MAFRFGKKRPAKLRTTLALTDFADMTWPSVQAQGWEILSKPLVLDILANDMVGDCVIAAAMHFAQNETANITGHALTPNRELTLQTYSAITGYDPAQTDANGDNPTDQGTDFESQLFPYWRDHGIPLVDENGNEFLHKILGFAGLDLGSVAQQRYANFTFGGVLWGINCPSSAEQDTSNWVVTPGATIVGGHGVNQTGQGRDGGHLNSWGLSIPFQWDFMRTYADEAYVVVTESWVDDLGQSPSGLNLGGLLNAMKGLSK